MDDTTDDAVLGGKLTLRQPRRGHRVGHDAILLAAWTSVTPGARVSDFGAGVGSVGLAIARRVPGVVLTMAEIDADLAALATYNASTNGIAARVVVADIADRPSLKGTAIKSESFDCVAMNPPFNDAASRGSPDLQRRLAHLAPNALLERWVDTARWSLVSGGILSLIWRADGLENVMTALAGFGSIRMRAIHPRPDADAIRVLVSARKDRRGPFSIMSPLVLEGAEAKSILAGISLG